MSATPGPWAYKAADDWRDTAGRVVQYGRYDISAGGLDEEDEHYYRVGSVSNVNNSGANLDNARLIAAAPELLAALKAMVERDWTIATDKAARAAIAKAGGA